VFPTLTCVKVILVIDNKSQILAKLLRGKGTTYILEYLHRNGTGQHRDFKKFLSNEPCNDRLRELLRVNYIQHHLIKDPGKREWYTLTDEGSKFLRLIKGLSELENGKEEFLMLFGLAGTKEILQHLVENGGSQHKDFDLSVSLTTLNVRLHKLLKFNLVEHHIMKKPTRREWYKITEKGMKAQEYLEDIFELVKEE